MVAALTLTMAPMTLHRSRLYPVAGFLPLNTGHLRDLHPILWEEVIMEEVEPIPLMVCPSTLMLITIPTPLTSTSIIVIGNNNNNKPITK